MNITVKTNTMKMQKTRNSCFGSEKRSTTLRQAKTGKHECRIVFLIRNNCCEFLPFYGVTFQSDIQLYSILSDCIVFYQAQLLCNGSVKVESVYDKCLFNLSLNFPIIYEKMNLCRFLCISTAVIQMSHYPFYVGKYFIIYAKC